MTWEKGSAFAQCFLMGQFGALSAITWITNDIRTKHDTQIDELKETHKTELLNIQQQVNELKKSRFIGW